MKKIIAVILLGSLTAVAQAQSFDDVLGTLRQDQTGNKDNAIRGKYNNTSKHHNDKAISKSVAPQALSNGLSSNDISNGLKEALSIGAKNAGEKLSARGGFFQNAAIKILMPPEAKQVESTLRQAGLGSVADKAILLMNTAAEDAASKAAPIFISAIKQMTIQDAAGILGGGNNAATNYLRRATSSQLSNAFKPVIQNSLGKVGADQVWQQVFSTYNKIPFVQKQVDPDLSGYVTQKAMQGLFAQIAIEEAKIRTNPAAHVPVKFLFSR